VSNCDDEVFGRVTGCSISDPSCRDNAGGSSWLRLAPAAVTGPFDLARRDRTTRTGTASRGPLRRGRLSCGNQVEQAIPLRHPEPTETQPPTAPAMTSARMSIRTTVGPFVRGSAKHIQAGRATGRRVRRSAGTAKIPWAISSSGYVGGNLYEGFGRGTRRRFSRAALWHLRRLRSRSGSGPGAFGSDTHRHHDRWDRRDCRCRIVIERHRNRWGERVETHRRVCRRW
jgi:hypothetical protein